MKAGILTIGDEILLGQIIDTNSAYIARHLSLCGLETGEIRSVADKPTELVKAIDQMLPVYEVLIVTGGLGPTKDDLSKKVLARYFDQRLVFHAETYRWIESMLGSKGIPVNQLNRDQALLPEKAVILPNRKGTAAGMVFEKRYNKDNGNHVDPIPHFLIALPGVPFEMEHLMQTGVLPFLKQKFPQSETDYRMFMVYNIAESVLAEKLESYENEMPEGITLAYLPSPGLVKLRVTAKRQGLPFLEKESGKLNHLLSEWNLCYVRAESEDKDGKLSENNLETHIGNLLRKGNYTLATAESCTGGYLAHLITSVAGSSEYFKGSVVAYSNEIKQKVLNVPASILDEYGAVSEPTVIAMAQGIQKLMGTDFALATSGIAGPGGGTEEKPVGSVWISIATPWDCEARLFHFSFSRERNIARSAIQALTWLKEKLEKKQ